MGLGSRMWAVRGGWGWEREGLRWSAESDSHRGLVMMLRERPEGGAQGCPGRGWPRAEEVFN